MSANGNPEALKRCGSESCFCLDFSCSLSAGMTMTVDTTAAARTRAMSSPNPSPSSPWAWANSSSPRHLPPPPFPARTQHLATQGIACCPCRSALACAWITTPSECISTTPTPCGAFTRGRWTVREPCIRLLASWAVGRFSWRSSSLLRD